MTVGAMRAIDRFVGIPLCLLAGLVARIVGRVHSSDHQHPGTILVIKFFGLGSILLSATFLEELRVRFPGARIIYLTFSSNRELLQKLPQVSDRVTISTSGFFTFIRDTYAAIALLRRASVDIVFDLEFFSKFSTLLSTFSGAPVRVGYELPTRWRRWNLTHPVPLDHSSHVVQVFMRQLEIIAPGENEAGRPYRLVASHEEKASLLRQFPVGNNGGENFAININAGPASLERRWPADRFMKVVQTLHAVNPARRFFLIGNLEERKYVDEAIRSSDIPNATILNCAGMFTIGELVALFEQCNLLLTNDSGPMHIAASVGTPVVALFGPESPQFYGPAGNGRIVYKAIECSPCLNMYNAKMFACPYNARCMREISVSEVLGAVNEILETASAGVRC